MKWLALIFAVFVSGSSVFAQSDAIHSEQDGIVFEVTLDPTSFVVGDIVALRIKAVTSDQRKLSIAESSRFGSFTILNQHNLLDIPDGQRRTWIWSMQLDTFDAATSSLEGIVIDWIDVDGSHGAIILDPIPVKITSVVGASLDEANLRDIKGMVPLISKSLWFFVFGIVLFLAFVTWLIWKSTRKPPQILRPHEIALRDIDALHNSQLAVLPFYTALSDIMRRYVEARFLITATGKTTGEFLAIAQQHPLIEHEDQQQLGSFLKAADLVKFAQHKPTDQTCVTAIEYAKHFITTTIPHSDSESMEHAA